MLLLTYNKFAEFQFKKNGQHPFMINNVPIELAEFNGEDMSSTVQTSGTVWDSSIILAKYLERHQAELNLSSKSVIELGAGRGIVGLALGAMNCRSVLLTDVEQVCESLRASVDLNHLANVSVRPLDWLANSGFGEFDIIVCADVVWVPELIEPLVRTISSLFKSQTVLYMAHQTRSKLSDDLFFGMLVQDGFAIAKVENDDLEFQKDSITIYKIIKHSST